MTSWLQKQWASYSAWHLLLVPLSWLFGGIVYIRRSLYQQGFLKSFRLDAPVIIVGNINVGGTGKTPLVIWLVEQLKLAGYTPGVISRGYGSRNNAVRPVFSNSLPAEVGDEPVLIVQRTHCPMFVGVNRVEAGVALLKAHPECNVIISDDGLQHYRLKRDVEIALVNANNLLSSNRCLLPAGSLREKIGRLKDVDAIVDSNSLRGANNLAENFGLKVPVFNMHLHGDILISLDGSQTPQSLDFFTGKSLVAIAGIGNPERFFNQLTSLGLQFERKIFSDHHTFTPQDLTPFKNNTILMTEKDAVKCKLFTPANAWYLPVTAKLNTINGTTLLAHVLQKIEQIKSRF